MTISFPAATERTVKIPDRASAVLDLPPRDRVLMVTLAEGAVRNLDVIQVS